MVLRIYASLILLLSISVTQAQNLAEQAQKKINNLVVLVEKANNKGINASKERVTLKIAEIYLKYAAWDEENVEWNKKSFELVPIFKEDAARMAEGLAEFERTEINTILQDAITEISLVLDGKHIRKNVEEVDLSKTEIVGNTIRQNGRPVFLIEHVWKPNTEYLNCFGSMDGIGFSPNSLMNASGEVSSKLINSIRNKPEINMGWVWLGHNDLPEWAIKKYEGINTCGGVFGKYDIDNPGAREIYSQLFKAVALELKGKKYTELGYVIFNEPSFFTQKDVWNTRNVSEYTMTKFRDWTKNKHRNIATLNAFWKTNYKSFDEVFVSIPMDKKLQGSPIWFDWMSFNNDRVTDYFLFLVTELKKYDPTARTHIKNMPWLWTEGKRDHGIDFEKLLRITDILGCDAMARDSHINGKHEEWMEKYSFMWEEISMMFDFFKSVQPNQIIFDTETHFLSSAQHRNLYLTPEYVRATYWLAHMHGLNASKNWYWARDENGKPTQREAKDYPGTNNQQPGVLNSLHTTMIDLNTFSEEITAIQQQRKPLRIFYSLPNAINRHEYMHDVIKTYESLYFEGVPLGFATAGIIKAENPKDWDAILIRETEVVTKEELDMLQMYLNNGGTIILDEASLKSNEYGVPHKKLQKTKGELIYISSKDEMREAALELLQKKDNLPPMKITQSNSDRNETCVWRCIKNEKGNYVVSIVNIGKTAVELQIQLIGKNIKLAAKDLITGVPLSTTPSLKPCEVYFAEIKLK